MSSNRVLDGCVDYQKCGEVIVSPKDNLIKMFCNFCCEIYDNPLQFLHHLHIMHNDVLVFSKPIDVYNIEDLLSQSDEEEEVEFHSDSSRSSDSGIPSNTSGEIVLGTKTGIFNAPTAYVEGETGKTDVVAEVEAMLFEDEGNVESKIQIDDTTDHGLELKQLLQDCVLKSIQVFNKKETIESNSKPAKIKTEKPRSTCDLKSYTIARSARQREQQQRMRIIKKRILRSLEKEPDSFTRKVQIDFREKPEYKQCSAAGALSDSNDAKENVNDENNSIAKRFPKSPLVINKVEILPNLNFILQHTQFNADQKIEKRRSSLTVVGSPPMVVKKPTRHPSFSSCTKPKYNQAMVQNESINLETKLCPKQTNKRKRAAAKILDSTVETKRTKTDSNPMGSPNFNLSESVVALLKSDWDTTVLNADSLLELAEPSEKSNSVSFETILSQVEGEMNKLEEKPAPVAAENADEVNATPKNVLRTDLSLLKVVGLPIIKDPFFEDRKRVEFIEMLRKKAAKFSKMFHSCSAVWNRKRFDPQFAENTHKVLLMLTEEANSELKGNLNVSELKRILNLINVWYAQHIDLKFFKKAKLSTTINHYMQLFAFLPKINHCLYYCEWCEESSSNQSSYERHRQTHLGELSCPYCNRVFKKKGFLVKHVNFIHCQKIKP